MSRRDWTWERGLDEAYAQGYNERSHGADGVDCFDDDDEAQQDSEERKDGGG